MTVVASGAAAWDPHFTEWMSLAEVYQYATTHFEHHRRQLTVAGAPDGTATGEVGDRPDRSDR